MPATAFIRRAVPANELITNEQVSFRMVFIHINPAVRLLACGMEQLLARQGLKAGDGTF